MFIVNTKVERDYVLLDLFGSNLTSLKSSYFDTFILRLGDSYSARVTKIGND